MFNLIIEFFKQLFASKWDGAGSFFAMLKMPDKHKHYAFAIGLAVCVGALSWVANAQTLLHPLTAHVLLIGTFFLFADEFGQFLHNRDLIAAGHEPDRGITIWDIAAGFMGVLTLCVAIEAYFRHAFWRELVKQYLPVIGG